jgi:kumamolisin
MSLLLRSLTLSSALIGLTAVAPSAATAAPIRAHAQDLGATPAAQTVTASIVLKVRSTDALEALVALTQEPGLPTFHHFLSVREFADLFAPSQRDIATITGYLAGFGITVTEVFADRLLIHATGTADAFNQAFAVDLHDFTKDGKRFHRGRHAPRVPLLLRDLLVSIQGISTEGAQFHPMRKNAASLTPMFAAAPVLPHDGETATGVPGSFTVGDVANMYNINPLYDAAIDGSGQTIGIATLANFDPADAFTYWDAIGLSVDPNRITQIHVDGGGELSADAGSGETCLDVQQSGGLAPGAKIIVYDAPNTDAGFIDLFYKAASDNLVDSLSVSWGSAEEFYFEAVTGEDLTAQLKAFHQAFLEAAVQGISMFASSGDSGAFDINDAFNDPVSNVLSVDIPGADPAITAAGGTTVPVTLNAGPGTPDLVVSQEQVWGWDYIENYLVAVLGPDFLHAFFPTGGGGGVSVFWDVPRYQAHTHGIRKSEPHQSVIFDDGSGAGPVDLLDLPAHFAGRNVPDVSLDGDPFSGFLLFSTTDGGLLSGEGGTSFVAPQLNGISALLSQSVGGRIGLWNPMLYRFKSTFGNSAHAPLVDVTAGDNWFYPGAAGYTPGAGLGVLNVANLASAIRHDRHGH